MPGFSSQKLRCRLAMGSPWPPPPSLNASCPSVCSCVCATCQTHRVTQCLEASKERLESSCPTHLRNGGVKAQRGAVTPCGLGAALTCGLRLPTFTQRSDLGAAGTQAGTVPLSQARVRGTHGLVILSVFHTWQLLTTGKNSCPRSEVLGIPAPGPVSRWAHTPERGAASASAHPWLLVSEGEKCASGSLKQG